MSQIAQLPPLEAPADVMAMARENCAERLRARGYPEEAAAFERCERDFAWATRHEVAKLLGEARPL
jgi:hypothetical protein